MDTKNACTLYLVRHGQTEWNVDHTLMGQKDSPLTKEGIQQAQAKAEVLKSIQFDAIFSSDLPRALKSAEMLKLDRDIVIQTSVLLRERSYGRFEGKPSSEMKAELKEKLLEREQLSGDAYLSFSIDDDIETPEELVTRFITQLREIALAYPGKTVLVVTHGGCIRTFLAKLGYADMKKLPPGSFSNAGHVTVLSDGVNFEVQEVEGIQNKILTV